MINRFLLGYTFILIIMLVLGGCNPDPKEDVEYTHHTAEILKGEYVSYDTIFACDKFISTRYITSQVIRIEKGGDFLHLLTGYNRHEYSGDNQRGYLNDYEDGSWIETYYYDPGIGEYSTKVRFEYINPCKEVYLFKFNDASEDYYFFHKIDDDITSCGSFFLSHYAISWIRWLRKCELEVIAKCPLLCHTLLCDYEMNNQTITFEVILGRLNVQNLPDGSIGIFSTENKDTPLSNYKRFRVMSVTRDRMNLISIDDMNKHEFCTFYMEPYPWSTMKKIFE